MKKILWKKMKKLGAELHEWDEPYSSPRRTWIQKTSVSLVARSGATPQSSILCVRNYVGSFF